MDSPIDCRFLRRFGIELEVNTLTGIICRPDTDSGEIPVGADYVSQIVHKTTREPVELQGWDHIHNNTCWIIKPDNSCGIEINSPILKGWTGLEKILKVIAALRDAGINSDRRCSLHVHVNIADLDEIQLASIIAHYIKCEHVFFDAIPPYRKNNRYCQLLGLTDLFCHDFPMSPMDIIHHVSGVKYYSLNAYHFIRGGGFSSDNYRKRTLEFRIAEGLACIDPLLAKNWIRFFLHFVEMTKNRPLPPPYSSGDSWSSLLWLNPNEVLSLLKFDQEDLLTPGLRQVRDWFVQRIAAHGYDTGLRGIWSNQGRAAARKEIESFMDRFKPQEIDDDPVYGKNYIL
jgi:hypothetical protein